MSLTAAQVTDRLATFIDPHTGLDLVSSKAVSGVGVDGSQTAVELRLGYPVGLYRDTLAAAVRAHLLVDPAISAATVSLSWRVHAHKVQGELSPLPGVRNIVAVASGKGGVGKSTTSVNLALALAAEGARVGILDADVYGPSQPRMLGVSGKPESQDGHHLEPKWGHGLQVMSIGFMVEEDTPMIWRGPMVTQALQQLLFETRWQDLDYLVIDLPPGTGDIQLTLCQRIPVSGALIVTTPQDIALLDARKALKMFEKVDVPVLGVVENMSVWCCPACGHVAPIFGAGGGSRMAEDYHVPLLAQLPLDMRIREETDGGAPTVAVDPQGPIGELYRELARKVAGRLSVQARNKSISFPQIVIQ